MNYERIDIALEMLSNEINVPVSIEEYYDKEIEVDIKIIDILVDSLKYENVELTKIDKKMLLLFLNELKEYKLS